MGAGTTEGTSKREAAAAASEGRRTTMARPVARSQAKDTKASVPGNFSERLDPWNYSKANFQYRGDERSSKQKYKNNTRVMKIGEDLSEGPPGSLTKFQEDLKAELCRWRNSFNVSDARVEAHSSKQKSKSNSSIFTVGEFCSGGCLDTLAAIRAGFNPIWSSEIDANQARMYEDLTGGKCLGDTFGTEVAEAPRVHYLKSGQPCTNWSTAGNEEGENGDTGWMFVKQVDEILEKRPWAFRLEVQINALNINGGAAVERVTTLLGQKYVIHMRKIAMWRLGDASNRKRLFIVGFDKKLEQAAHEYYWPKPSFTEHNAPIARLIAVPDEEIPATHWRYDQVAELDSWENHDVKGAVQVIARTGQGMGPPGAPHVIAGWDALLNGPTALGGGARGPELDWKSGEPIKRTRLRVPTEYCRAASLSDEYLQWAAAYAPGNVIDFQVRCINNGVPLRSSVAIDTAVMNTLAVRMYREQVIFECPYVQALFKSKSFAAFFLKDGLNYLQWLGLPEVETSRRRAAIPADFKEKVVVQLPAHNSSPERKAVKPIKQLVAVCPHDPYLGEVNMSVYKSWD